VTRTLEPVRRGTSHISAIESGAVTLVGLRVSLDRPRSPEPAESATTRLGRLLLLGRRVRERR